MPSLGEVILYMKGDDSKLSGDLDNAKGKASSFAGTATQLIGGAVAGAAVAAGAAILAIGKGAFDVSADTKQAASDMAASLGLPLAEAEKFADVARTVYGKNLGESVGEAAKAVGLLAQQMGLAADDPALQTMTENALRLQKTFGIDVSESIGTVKNLMDNFGISGQEAFDLIAAGNQKGLNASGDLLESINEYSVQFASGGATAGEFFSLMESGFQNGVLGTDKAADAFKEFRVRIQDGSTLTSESLEQLGLDSETILAGLQNGTLTAADAFKMVTTALGETDDKTLQFQAGVGLLGTQFEDLGTDIATSLNMTNDWSAASKGAVDSLKPQYTSFGTAMEAMWRRITVSVSPFTDKLLELVNDAMPSIMGAFDTFDKSVVPIMNGIGSTIDTVVNAVKGYLSGFKSSVDTDGNGPLKFWKEWADTNLPLVQTLFSNVLGAIQGLWEIFGPAIQLIADTTFGTIFTLIDTAMRNIGDVITLALQLLTGDFEGAKTTLEGIVQRTWDAIYGIFSNTLETIKTLITSVDWGELGSNIIEGISNGISNAAGKIAEAAKKAAKSAYEAAKSWLGISSPSKKTEDDIGKPFAEGIGVGIEKQIRGLTGNVNLGLGGLMSGIQTPALAGAGAMNITVNVSGDNATYEGGRAVGRGIMDEMRRRGA